MGFNSGFKGLNLLYFSEARVSKRPETVLLYVRYK